MKNKLYLNLKCHVDSKVVTLMPLVLIDHTMLNANAIKDLTATELIVMVRY